MPLYTEQLHMASLGPHFDTIGGGLRLPICIGGEYDELEEGHSQKNWLDSTKILQAALLPSI